MGISQRATANMGGSQPAHISIKGQKFTLVGDDGSAEPVAPTPKGYALDVIVADANPNSTRVCYLKDYDPKATDAPPPDCWSNDGINPDSSLGDAAGPYDMQFHHLEGDGGCTKCFANRWGSEKSKVSGKGVKKCKEGKALAVVVASDIPQHGQAYALRITPGARKLWQSYINELNKKKLPGGGSIDVSHVITRLTFDPQVQGVLNFTPVGFVHETDIDLQSMYEEHVFAPLLGGIETPPEQLPAPLTPALVHQSKTAEPAQAAPKPAEKKTEYALPFDDEIPFA